MNKKRQIILILFLGFISSGAYSQFNTIRKTPKQYVIIKQETRTDENFDIYAKSNIPQQQGRNNVAELIADTLDADIVDTTEVEETELIEDKKAFKGLHLPLKKLFVTSHFGYRKDPFTGKRTFHRGTDFRSSSDSVYSIIPGKIKKIGYDRKGLGNFVEIKNGDFTIIYGHLKTSIGTKGNYVGAGDVVGISGSTGRSTGDHLHLTIKYKGKIINPLPLIRFIESYGKEEIQLAEK